MPYLPRTLALLVLSLGLALAGCRQEAAPEHFVARIGDRYLSQQELAEALAALPLPADSAEAREQLIEQWVTNELLYQEAQQRGLRDEPVVQRMLRESERSVLVSALIAQLYDEAEAAPTPAELQAYFSQHREQLRLREPFVRLRLLGADDRPAAEAARRALQQAVRIQAADSLWPGIVERFAASPDDVLPDRYFPERRVLAAQPALRDALERLADGALAPVVAGDSLFYVLQLVDRVPVGTLPEQAWVEEELARRLVIQRRKQMYARQVQRLRNEAMARQELEVR